MITNIFVGIFCMLMMRMQENPVWLDILLCTVSKVCFFSALVCWEITKDKIKQLEDKVDKKEGAE